MGALIYYSLAVVIAVSSLYRAEQPLDRLELDPVADQAVDPERQG